jgi:hypothetical protein
MNWSLEKIYLLQQADFYGHFYNRCIPPNCPGFQNLQTVCKQKFPESLKSF